MARITEVKFGDFQVEKRYKELQRELKLASLRQQSSTDESLPSSLPRISNINIDSASSGSNVPVLHISEIENDVISSSKNLKNILSKKEFSGQNDTQESYLTMQPPKSHIVPRISKRMNNTFTYNAQAFPMPQNKYISSYIELNKRKQNFELPNTTMRYTSGVNFLQSGSENLLSKEAKVLMKWKVMLNRKGQLVIKGMLQCKQNFESKPIARRLSSTSVESACKDVYYLQGNIVDDEHELPEYVKGKFYNGFPDDWENVLYVWRMFVQQGCKVSFRWPAPIADSDDDLRSEVTDVTYQYLERSKYEVSDAESSKKSQSPELPPYSGYLFSVSQRDNDQTFTLHNCTKRDSFTQTSLCGITENSFYKVDVETPLNHYACDAECNKKPENTRVEYFRTKNKDKLKDKLNVILNNLLDKNCPKKCIAEIIEIAKFFNYIVSVEDDESSTEDLRLKNSIGEQNKETCNESGKSASISLLKDVARNKNTRSNLIANHKCTSEKEGNIVSNKVTNNYEPLPRKRTFIEMNKDNDSDSESENEVYAGAPRIPVKRLLRSKKVLMKPSKRKRKRMVHQKYDRSKQRVSNISSIESYTDRPGSKQTNSVHSNDFSVDITKYERCSPNAKRRDINPNIQNGIPKPINFDTTETEQSDRLNNLNKDKNTYEVQKCFMRENSTPIHRQDINNFYNSFDETKNGESKSKLSGIGKNIENETSFNVEEMSGESNPNTREMNVERNPSMGIINKRNNELQDYTYCELSKESLYHSTSNVTKPTIVSSVPVNIKIKNLKTRHSLRKLKAHVVKNESKDTEDLKKENETNNWMRNKSPKKIPAIRKANSTLLTNSKKDLEKHVEAQLDNIDSIASNTPAQPTLETLKDNQQDAISCKPKSLSAWVPKVLCESELSLIFEGTLLNDAGHIVHKKYQTKGVLRRVSAKLIETVDHEFYRLIGDLNDTKHVIPKQLINHCRYGCPSRIDQFCRTWKLLQNDPNAKGVNVGVSSKGRRIIRPLNYWTGERVTFTDDNVIYSPGILQENSDQNKQAKTRKIQGKNSSMKSSSDESESSPGKSADKTVRNAKQIKSKRSRKFVIKHERRKDVEMQESNYSNSEDVSPRKKQTMTPFKPVNMNNKQNVHSTSIENSCEPSSRHDETKLIKRSTRATENTNSNISCSMFTNREYSAGRYRDVIGTYFGRIPFKDDILSDDLESRI